MVLTVHRPTRPGIQREQALRHAGARAPGSSASMQGDAQMNSTPPDGEPITPAGLVALEAEINELETTGRREMAARILAARELGDLSENADYHIAKEDQAHLETKIKRLRERRTNARIVETDTAATGAAFEFGSTAEVLDEESGKVHTWTIVGSTEANLRRASSRPSHRSRAPCSVALRGSRCRCARPVARAATGCSASSSDTVAVTASHARSSSPLSRRRRRRGRAAVAARARCA